ncbi:transcriptional regulator, TetR family [Paenibacillus sophorae]|uniref:TetR/AcrR family transcriptional regulator n=1 Tax=Paenibacillus sophorae TaxID=1333845 RepID=A0A1H8THZ2_9BACL|nr:TetR/AcrR family transcriptional regulator [Paenibacillus sophorae]QWU16197.1 TetR/AcrR family transcriptional regulator [Paenibacillus sophorae]SEO90163.1 transcriptional regulator, TetR family [Paenibacillus sophorae]
MSKKHIDSKRDDIINAAVTLFSQKGIDGTNVKEIGKLVGVTDAALYKHFPSKTALAEQVYIHYLEQYTKVIDYFANMSIPFNEKLAFLIQELMKMIAEDRFGFLLLGQNHDCLSEVLRNRRQPAMALVDLIQAGVHNHEIPNQDPYLSATLFIGAFLRLPILMDNMILPQQLEQTTLQIQVRIAGLLGSK